ncbi:MAG: cation diffusion facilitator family transporter [Gaiella sp.]
MEAGLSPERRTALISVAAAVVLIALKLAVGLASGSLAFVAEAAHSGTDLVAALLTLYAVGVARRPADSSHLYGHGKAEHLAALGEASVLGLVSLGVAGLAVYRLVVGGHEVDATWWAFAVAALVILIDGSRALISLRTGRRYRSAALLSNALHFTGDLAGTLAVIAGLVAVRAGWAEGDAVAALFVALLVVMAATRLAAANIDVLMDRAPAREVAAVRRAIERLDPPVPLGRLRVRQAAGRVFVDLAIEVSPGAAVGQGHAAADRVEAAVERAVPGADVVVHVEPRDGAGPVTERVRAAAMSVSHVREIHDLAVIELAGGGLQAVLHIKLPGDLALERAHRLAEQVEVSIRSAVPEVSAVHTHLEPLAGDAAARELGGGPALVDRVVQEITGAPPRATRFLRTDEGLVVLLTLGIGGSTSLAEAHERASAVSRTIREELAGVADVVVHTEP